MMNLDARWAEMSILPESAQFQRVDDSHPLDFYIGKDASGKRVLLLISKEDVFPVETHAIQVLNQRRGDGKYALMFRLEKSELEKLFALVCDDLVESSRINPKHPASFVLSRFKHWQRMLEKSNSGLLDDESLRGLIGELLFLELDLIPSRGKRESVDGWCGPLGADRDFAFSDREFEVKTMTRGSDRVIVSSAEQLDTLTKPVELAIVSLEAVDSRMHNESFTISDIVNRLRKVFEDEPLASEIFELRLIDAGLVLCESYDEKAFYFAGIRKFQVLQSFPAIRRSSLPSGIGGVRWELMIRSIIPFEVTPRR